MPDSQAASPTIILDRVAIIRGSRLILRDFSLEAESGELIWVRGANGSGKSTLFRALSGLLPEGPRTPENNRTTPQGRFNNARLQG
ncbi:ATP-binding cassette domain-containing protein, partial [Sphingorhabdus sp.]|uniref:ATP-binding cassette domain-containing protein n=1 Tax=Sphingorhabdus sp. TaxID=1902408 RepID=UPI0035B23BD2